ncbi:hypothetical protein [Enterococcus wangshanyuanii]|uniref:Uncharacterized protein n=1 Tax=Enterococcus wangshanyuanii TaxID=2005703 RepID=A0ABQ1PIU8_9ENTE|nr:hypothetical protein [Enterococcus wangshanyuanii]GGC97835.1 hypothetical protein GCM10011573_29210 [Enterococcus wangshanyuanii]
MNNYVRHATFYSWSKKGKLKGLNKELFNDLVADLVLLKKGEGFTFLRLNKVPTFRKVMNCEDEEFRKTKIRFVQLIKLLPDGVAQVSLLAGYGLLMEYKEKKTLKERRLKLMRTLSISYDTLEEIEWISIQELAKYIFDIKENEENFLWLRKSSTYHF